MSGPFLTLIRSQVLRILAVPLALVLAAAIALSACTTDDTETNEAPDQVAQAAQSASAAASSAAQNEQMEDEVPGDLTIYSGRGESLVGPIIERFEELTGIDVRVRYAGTAELAVAILEEGDRSPADVYYAQDAGALAALAENGVLAQLPDDIVGSVPAELADASGRWVAASGRARVWSSPPTAYQTRQLQSSILSNLNGADESVGRRPTAASRHSSPPCVRFMAKTPPKSGYAA